MPSNPDTTIDLIIRDVAELEYGSYPGQPPDEMHVTADELRAILEDRLGSAENAK